MPAVIEELGKPELLIHGIAMKPGKPTILSSIEGKLLITLPGYPTSALIVYYTIVDPSIRKMAHEPPYRFQTLRAYTSTRVYSEIGRREFKPCRISGGEGQRIKVEPVPTGSEAITTLANADGFMIISEDTEFIGENQEVEVHIFPHRVDGINRPKGVQL
jgi:molybdopterin biosynthesis enzyme